MRKLEMKIEVPGVNDGRIISTEVKDGYILLNFEVEEGNMESINSKVKEAKEKIEVPVASENSEFECKIDPIIFDGVWMEHEPSTERQKETLDLYKEAKSKGMLHSFTCMTIDPTVINKRLIYKKDQLPAVGLPQKKWKKILKEYNPRRNSRQMTRTEFICRNLFIIQKLVESGYGIDRAWYAVCDDSKEIGHYNNSYDAKGYFETTGSREVCGFYDLANTSKLLAEDPWNKNGGFWIAGGHCRYPSNIAPVADMYHSIDIGFD